MLSEMLLAVMHWPLCKDLGGAGWGRGPGPFVCFASRVDADDLARRKNPGRARSVGGGLVRKGHRKPKEGKTLSGSLARLSLRYPRDTRYRQAVGSRSGENMSTGVQWVAPTSYLALFWEAHFTFWNVSYLPYKVRMFGAPSRCCCEIK